MNDQCTVLFFQNGNLASAIVIIGNGIDGVGCVTHTIDKEIVCDILTDAFVVRGDSMHEKHIIAEFKFNENSLACVDFTVSNNAGLTTFFTMNENAVKQLILQWVKQNITINFLIPEGDRE